MLKIVYRKVEFGDLKLPVAPNNGDRHFSKLFNMEETQGIIHSRIYPARDVVQLLFNVFLTQNYELQFSFSVIISFFSFFFFFFIKYVVSYYYDQYSFHLVLSIDIITDI